jgi:menaquinone-dependent protoporphyrinogen oxidase
MDEKPPVLVGYATAAGSTRGVAERIAGGLRDAGLPVTCASLGPELHPDEFAAWVLGSAIHNMAWLPPATEFLTRAAATPRPCWAFSVGGMSPSGALRHWLAGREVQRIQREFPAGLTVRDHQLFAGVISTQGVSWAGRVFWRALGGRPGDQRNWPAIDRWAAAVAAELAESSPAGHGQQSPGTP